MANKQNKQNISIDYIITASFAYGPFKTKREATLHRAKVSKTGSATISPIKKLVAGYKFTASLRVGCTAADKDKTYKLVKSSAPTAKLSIKKA